MEGWMDGWSNEGAEGISFQELGSEPGRQTLPPAPTNCKPLSAEKRTKKQEFFQGKTENY